MRLLLSSVHDEDHAARLHTTKETAVVLRTAAANARRMIMNRELTSMAFTLRAR